MSNNTSKIDAILDVLHIFESAPSARCLVTSIVTGELTHEQAQNIYENSEGENDVETERIVRAMSSSELESLKSALREISLEHKIDNEEDYNEMVDGVDVDAALN